MKRQRVNNDGYSLVELIIVIAIIMVLGTVSFLSLNYIKTAKAKEASVTLDNQVSNLLNRARNQACKYDNGDGTGESVHKSDRFIILVYKNADGSYYVKRGYTGASGDIYVDAENGKDGKGVSLTSYVDIKYNDGSGSVLIDNVGQKIIYDASSRCVYGDGDFEFYGKNSSLLSKVTINKNGSHNVN